MGLLLLLYKKITSVEGIEGISEGFSEGISEEGISECNTEDSNWDNVSKDLGPDDLKEGVEFTSLKDALNTIKKWQDANSIPLIRRSTTVGTM